MKTIEIISIAWMSLILFTACDKVPVGNGQSPSDEVKDLVEVPFKANFFTIRNYSMEDEAFCSEDPFLNFNYQVGEGTGTRLGHFTTTIRFCAAELDYKNGDGVFVAANGDELYFNVPSTDEVGHILPFEHELYEFQFQDPFMFTGGTGKFEGACGEGMTNSFVDLLDAEGNFIPEHRTDHEWTGILVLPKGNK